MVLNRLVKKAIGFTREDERRLEETRKRKKAEEEVRRNTEGEAMEIREKKEMSREAVLVDSKSRVFV